MSGSTVIESHAKDPMRNKSKEIPVANANINNRGFPFDDSDFESDQRDYSLESQLSDIAKRHPEFAEHLNFGGSFPSRRTRPPGGTSTTQRRRPFATSRLNDLGFPFEQYFETEPEDFRRETSQVPRQQYYTSKEEPEVPQSQREKSGHKVQQSSQGTQTDTLVDSSNSEKPVRNIQQSNTVDLGQKQEPIVEERTQRSMSAPPENHPPRFVSSINIPINRESSGDNMGARASAQEQTTTQSQAQQNKPTERVIPIHVEGRDEPVIPKNINSTYTSPPQPDRIFSQKPSHFTQFVNPDDKFRQHQFQRNQNFPKQSTEPMKSGFSQQQQQSQQQQPAQPTQQQEQPQKSQQDVQQESQEQVDQKPASLELIQLIQKDVLELMTQVENFDGKPKDKQYLYLDEMLTRNLIKLDNIETEGKENIRQARKEAIKCIQSCIAILEAKANANANYQTEVVVEGTKTEIEEKPKDDGSIITTANEPMTLEVSGVVRAGNVVINDENDGQNNETTMEVEEPQKSSVNQEEKPKEPTEAVTENTEQQKDEHVQEQKQVECSPVEVVAKNSSSNQLKETENNSSQKQELKSENKNEKVKGKKKDKQENPSTEKTGK